MTLTNKDTHLEFKLASAVATTEWDFTASWFEANMFGGNKQTGTSNGVTAVKLIEGPNQGDIPSIREPKKISIKNRDTVAGHCIIQYNDEGTVRLMYKAYLNPDWTLFYEEHRGWYLLDEYGNTVINTSTDEMIDIIAATADGLLYTGSHPSVAVLTHGLEVNVYIPSNNTGAVQFNFSSLGANSAKNFGHSAFVADELEADVWYKFKWNANTSEWQCLTPTDLIQNNV